MFCMLLLKSLDKHEKRWKRIINTLFEVGGEGGKEFRVCVAKALLCIRHMRHVFAFAACLRPRKKKRARDKWKFGWILNFSCLLIEITLRLGMAEIKKREEKRASTKLSVKLIKNYCLAFHCRREGEKFCCSEKRGKQRRRFAVFLKSLCRTLHWKWEQTAKQTSVTRHEWSLASECRACGNIHFN